MKAACTRRARLRSPDAGSHSFDGGRAGARAGAV